MQPLEWATMTYVWALKQMKITFSLCAISTVAAISDKLGTSSQNVAYRRAASFLEWAPHNVMGLSDHWIFVKTIWATVKNYLAVFQLIRMTTSEETLSSSSIPGLRTSFKNIGMGYELKRKVPEGVCCFISSFQQSSEQTRSVEEKLETRFVVSQISANIN